MEIILFLVLLLVLKINVYKDIAIVYKDIVIIQTCHRAQTVTRTSRPGTTGPTLPPSTLSTPFSGEDA